MAIGILAALVQRNATGTGQMVEVAMQEAVLNLTRVRFTGTLTDGNPEPRTDSLRGVGADSVGGLLPCAPGGPNDCVYLMVPPDNPGMFVAAVGAMGRPDLADDPRFNTVDGRRDNAPELTEIIGDWAMARSKEDVMAAFAGAGVPCGAVLDTAEVLGNAHLRERRMVSDVEHPTRGKYAMIGCPVKLSGSPVEVTRAPLYGEHTNEVFTALGGLTDEDVEELRREKVIA